MKRLILLGMAMVMTTTMLLAQTREGLTEYKLDNGLTVMLWEDHDQPDVTGYVAVRAGAMDEPAEYTGLAHYLEHMLFKGTQKIGALDWEKEKPYYEEIIRLYDEYAVTTDEAKRAELTTKINEASIEAAKYATVEDFFVLLDGIGATGVNAFTSYDMTCYHNSFPAANMYKWLTIFSDRLIDPVFRTFQAELENVFEEYNMYEDNPSTHVRKTLMSTIFAGHPYERDVIGLPEHLKNPRLSKLIDFYNTWYVPNNMALIIVGDFDTETTKPMIEETFGRLEYKELPARPTYVKTSFAGNPKHKFKMGYYPMVIWAYDGVNMTDEDLLPLQFVASLLNNSTNTGLLDKLNIRRVPLVNGNLSIPRMDSSSRASWIGEAKPIGKTQPTFGEVNMRAKKLAALIPVSNTLLRTSGVNLEGWIAEDLIRNTKVELDNAFLNGTGTQYMPLGLANNADIQTTGGSTTALALTTPNDMVALLQQANVRLENVHWLLNPIGESWLRNKAFASGPFAWSDEMSRTGKLRGFEFHSSSTVAYTKETAPAKDYADFWLGDFAEMMFGISHDITIEMSRDGSYTANGQQISAFENDLTLVRLITECDFACRQPKAFVHGTFAEA